MKFEHWRGAQRRCRDKRDQLGLEWSEKHAMGICEEPAELSACNAKTQTNTSHFSCALFQRLHFFFPIYLKRMKVLT